MKPPDILNSKIKKIRIELPHYSFSHSSSGDSPHVFIGRERIREKLKKVVEDSPDEPGVYLIAGNRGVGKTSLVSWVINETSLPPKSKFTENFRYFIFLLLAVIGIQYLQQEFTSCFQRFPPCLQEISQFAKTFWFLAVFFILSVPSFIILCLFNSYRHKIPKQKYIKTIFNGITSGIKELSYFINHCSPYGKMQYVLKIILVVCYTQICSLFLYVTPIKAFIFYLCFVFACMFRRFARERLREYYRKYKKDKKDESSKNSIYFIENKNCIEWINCIFKYYSVLMLLFLPLVPFGFIYKLLLMSFPFIIVLFLVFIWCCKYLEKGILFKIIFFDLIVNPIKNYIKNHNRLYLRINFGHKLKDEKDILRLIARTLNTEYDKYHRSFIRMLPKRVVAFVVFFLFACLFSNIVESRKFYNTMNNIIEKQQKEYDKIIRKSKSLEDAFSGVDTKIKNIEKTNRKNNVGNPNENLLEKTNIETKVNTNMWTRIGIILRMLDQLVLEISKRVENIPRYLWSKETDYKDFDIDYLFWLSFFLIYLFFILIFRSIWITNFFVTHKIIKRRLKKLNSDITHSSELEKSIGINKEKNIPIIGVNTKKSRDVADAREIEKELQDILYDMQRIPVIMCRPKVVIVFDELDKVEPGDTSSEKENPQTKASLFSIHATRERQTEILRILSNMKYFLSTVKVKFIFIAGREMFDIHLADVSERNNYIGSIFNVVILVPSFLTDHHTGMKHIPQESSIASLPEEFVCRRLIPHDYPVESYDLENYRVYLENEIFKSLQDEVQKKEKLQKIIAVLQQFIIYLAHVSKGAPKKMLQLFESFVEIRTERDDKKNTLLVQRYHSSRHFLSFNYYKQYTLGIVAYLITPIFYRLAESNIKEHSDKLLVSSLRFVDFLFKFHKNSFSWKHLDMSPEILEVNRAPELKSVAVDLLNYLTQVHINKSNFSLSDYKFDGLIANEIFAMAKTDEVFSALFSFSLDEMLPLKKHYQDLLEKKEKEYQKKERTSVYIDAISSLQGVLGDLHYYDDELESAEAYYKSAVQGLHKNKDNREITLEKLYTYVRNMLRLGIIYEKRKQYDFAYMIYGELCKRIIQERNITIGNLLHKLLQTSLHLLLPQYFKETSPKINDIFFKKMTYEGLKMLYLPFIAKLQILEQSHMGGITPNHLEQLDTEFEFLTADIDIEGAKLLKAEFCSRVADVLYYKNSDLKNINFNKDKKNSSCTACDYYCKALSFLLNIKYFGKPNKNTVVNLLCAAVDQLNNNNNMKYCTILARILSDWGNVFFSCDTKSKKGGCGYYICKGKSCNTHLPNIILTLKKYINYIESESKKTNRVVLINALKRSNFTKMEIAFTMYSISSVAYRKANLYKRSSYQIFKMLCLFKHYEIYNNNYIKKLSKNAIHFLFYANENLELLELNKRKKDFNKTTIKEEDKIPLQFLLLDSEITRIRIFVKELELKMNKTPEKLKKYYDMRITSPYKINYSIVGRIYQLRLKSIVNYEVYQKLLENFVTTKSKRTILSEIKYILEDTSCNETSKVIFENYFNFGQTEETEKRAKINILENLIAESIYCLIDIAQLSETVEETFVFSHCFLGTIHDHLSLWIRLYETYEIYKKGKSEIRKHSRIDKYLEQYLDQEWREQLSGYRENQRALSRYYKSLEMHSEGRAYHNMIDTMCYIRDDFNDRSDHFNIAEERHLIVNGKIDGKINALKNIYKESKLYKVENYYE